MTPLELAATSFVVALSGALMPGPLLTVTVAEAARRGAVAGPLLIIGHALLEVALVVTLVAGVGALATTETVLVATGAIGSVVLVSLGVATLKGAVARGGAGADAGEGRAGGGALSLVGRGALVSAANPYWIVWWLTVGAAFLARGLAAGAVGVAAFFLGHVAADFAWYAFVAAGAHHGSARFGDRGLVAVQAVCGAALVLIGAWFAADAIGRLR